jgi:hypothetical protein
MWRVDYFRETRLAQPNRSVTLARHRSCDEDVSGLIQECTQDAETLHQ